MDTDNFIVYIKTDNIYKDIAEDVETKFDISNYKLDSPLPRENWKKSIRLMKGKLGGKSWKKFLNWEQKHTVT